MTRPDSAQPRRVDRLTTVGDRLVCEGRERFRAAGMNRGFLAARSADLLSGTGTKT
jgi:hypothetical protein